MTATQFTVGPRVEFRFDSYPRIRAWDPEIGEDRFVYLHRLYAYAHGLIDDLWADVDVHHRDCDGWNSMPGNLDPKSRQAHIEEEPHVENLK